MEGEYQKPVRALAIQRRADTIVDRENAIADVVKERRNADLLTIPSDEQIIEVNSHIASTVRMRHRDDIRRI